MQFLTHLLPAAIAAKVSLALGSVDSQASNYSPDLLSREEKNVWDTFKSDHRRHEYLATRGLIRQMIQQLELDPAVFDLKKDALGRPYGHYEGDNFYLSIAHTREYILCGLSSRLAIGVDLEPYSRKVPSALRSRIMNDQEVPLVDDEPTLRLWTIKEALVKLKGQGMRMNLDECTITAKEGSQFTAKFNDDKRAKICSFQRHNHWLAVAWKC